MVGTGPVHGQPGQFEGQMDICYNLLATPDGDGSDDAMVLCTPKALPKHRCAGHCALGA